jgi:hypothetical protein
MNAELWAARKRESALQAALNRSDALVAEGGKIMCQLSIDLAVSEAALRHTERMRDNSIQLAQEAIEEMRLRAEGAEAERDAVIDLCIREFPVQTPCYEAFVGFDDESTGIASKWSQDKKVAVNDVRIAANLPANPI